MSKLCKCAICNTRPIYVSTDPGSGYLTCLICHKTTLVYLDTFIESWKKRAKEEWNKGNKSENLRRVMKNDKARSIT